CSSTPDRYPPRNPAASARPRGQRIALESDALIAGLPAREPRGIFAASATTAVMAAYGTATFAPASPRLSCAPPAPSPACRRARQKSQTAMTVPDVSAKVNRMEPLPRIDGTRDPPPRTARLTRWNARKFSAPRRATVARLGLSPPAAA